MTDYAAVEKETFTEFQELLNGSSSSWTVIKEADGILLEAIPREGSYINCYRVHGHVEGSAKDAADALWGWGKEEWQKMTSDLVEFEKIGDDEFDSSRQRIVYQRSSLPWPLWHRDVCLFSFRKEVDGGYYVLFKSIKHEKVPEKPSEFVRATVLIGGYVFIPDGEAKCKVVRIIHLEPNGSIPSSIVNMKAGELHTQMAVFQTLF